MFPIKRPGYYVPTIVKYYRTENPDGSSNSSSTKYVTDPLASDVYRGIKNLYMCKKNYTTLTSDILTFEGHRTPAANGLPPLYKETLTINSTPYRFNFISATATYVDYSNGFETTVPFIDYTVIAASGMYQGYSKIRIAFDNKNHTRIVYIS